MHVNDVSNVSTSVEKKANSTPTVMPLEMGRIRQLTIGSEAFPWNRNRSLIVWDLPHACMGAGAVIGWKSRNALSKVLICCY
jgi:hypothetical protein